MLFKTALKARLDKFPVYTSFEYISLNKRVCVVYRPPFIDGISGGTFFDEIELFEILG